MKRFFCTIGILALFCTLNSYAACPEKLNFKGGVVVEGHILSQEIGETITFSVERTFVTMPSKWIAMRVEANRPYSALNATWKQWLKDSGTESEYKESTKEIAMLTLKLLDKSKIKLSTKNKQSDSISYNVLSNIFNKESRLVHVIEDGAYISFIDLSNCVCKFKWSDIYSVEFAEREKHALNGIVDVIEDIDENIYKGQIIEKILEERIRLKKTDGMIVNILNENINSIKKEKLNPDESIFRQAQYLDDVDGTKGIIICQQVNHPSPYIKMLYADENEKQISLDKIKIIRSVENKKYEPLSDIIIESDEVYFDKRKTFPVVCKNRKGAFALEKDSVKNISELYLNQNKHLIEVYFANSIPNKSAIFLPVNNEGTGKDINLSFSYEDVLQKGILPEKQSISINNTLRMVYKVTPGYYVLYIPKTGKCYFCNIKTLK